MKKTVIGAALLALSFGFVFTGCNKKGQAPAAGSGNAAKASGFELALTTDSGTINDKSFNQGAWEGLVAYANENSKTVKYYQPAEISDEAYAQSIDLAVKGGAKVIVCPGYNFETSIWDAQTKYPDVCFILLDGTPHNEDGSDTTIGPKTVAVLYSEQQAGFLAGYAAVKEGYKKLGFMGGVAVPAVIRYGYGFVQGAEYAAEKLGVTGLECKYTYVGNFSATPENMAKAASWYNDGTEVIFACGGAVGNSVMKAAETAGNGKAVIGVDVDQSSESVTVITSAMKNLGQSVKNLVAAYYSGSFPGGKVLTLGADNDGVELPFDSSKFTKFTRAEYDELFKALASNSIAIKDNTAAAEADGLGTKIVKVEVIK